MLLFISACLDLLGILALLCKRKVAGWCLVSAAEALGLAGALRQGDPVTAPVFAVLLGGCVVMLILDLRRRQAARALPAHPDRGGV